MPLTLLKKMPLTLLKKMPLTLLKKMPLTLLKKMLILTNLTNSRRFDAVITALNGSPR
jgi:hypothetical protein